MSTSASQTQFSEFVLQSRLLTSIFHQWRSVTRPEQLQAKTPIIVCLSIQCRHHLFQNTREAQFGLHVRQLFCEERLSCGSTTQSLWVALAGAYPPAGRTFLFLMCAVMSFMLIPCGTTKFHMLTIKGKNCVFTTQFGLHSYHY